MSEFNNSRDHNNKKLKDELEYICDGSDYSLTDFKDMVKDKNDSNIFFDITSKSELDGIKITNNKEKEEFIIREQEGKRMGEGIICKSVNEYTVRGERELYRRVRKKVQGASRFKI